MGEVVFDSDEAVRRSADGTHVILVRRETNPDDLHGMVAAHGILTSRGGKTSHAAVVARGMGRTCVCGAEALDVDTKQSCFTTPDGTVVRQGDTVSIDGSTGEVFLGEVDVIPSPVVRYFEGSLDPSAPDTEPIVRSVHRLMGMADKVRRLRVRANADNAPDAARARRFGAEGIGLARTEHMFLGKRREMVEKLILAESEEARQEVFDRLLPLQRADFVELFEAMEGQPVTVRLLDPPLHEFLPDLTELSVRVAIEDERGEHSDRDSALLHAVLRLHEQNPMLGLRGVRLGLAIPGLFAMQARAILEAAALVVERGGAAVPGDHGSPRRGGAGAQRHPRGDRRGREHCRAAYKVDLDHTIGTMIELPACRPHRRRHRRCRRLLLLRHQRPHPDRLGLLPRRRRVLVLLPLPREGDLRRVTLRDHRPDRRRAPGADGHLGGPRAQARAQGGRVWRARRRPRVDPLLPRLRAGLRVLLPVPRAGGTARGRPGCAPPGLIPAGSAGGDAR